jgi:hypothetical protein
MPVVQGNTMTATKAELKNAFEAGQRAPRGDYQGFAFNTYWEAVREEREAARAEKKRIEKEIQRRMRVEFRKRNGLDIGEADRPPPPYTKD